LIPKVRPLKSDPHRSGCGFLESYLRISCESQGRVDIGRLSLRSFCELAQPGLRFRGNACTASETTSSANAIVVCRHQAIRIKPARQLSPNPNTGPASIRTALISAWCGTASSVRYQLCGSVSRRTRVSSRRPRGLFVYDERPDTYLFSSIARCLMHRRPMDSPSHRPLHRSHRRQGDPSIRLYSR